MVFVPQSPFCLIFYSYRHLARANLDGNLTANFADPDHQPLQIYASRPSQRVEEQYASSSLFTGGHDRATRAHLKDKSYEEDEDDDSEGESEIELGSRKALPSSISNMSKIERKLSLVKTNGNDFDHNQWLFETKGSYGYGNIMWPTKDGKEVREALRDK
ncbi:hypothetical protein CDL15_Pgr028534 [Punica granatum]|uniref:Uncharacterized protein n=1 Tax=Punica granatum TaxID=22663 RepID=A0A218VW68_PUNGR|nr:hypothetical protein CDL15_Pgr028534 [Punica granatum]